MHTAMRTGVNDDAYGRAAAARIEHAARIGLAVGVILAVGGSIAWAINMAAHVGPITTIWGLITAGACTCVTNTRHALRGRNAELIDAMNIGAAIATARVDADQDAEIFDSGIRRHSGNTGTKRAI